ncbi:MAG: peptide chain release factor 2 [Arsenophonus sp.]|nr:MAG: peptide chain release factor 2 [Arsenophonus sp.]
MMDINILNKKIKSLFKKIILLKNYFDYENKKEQLKLINLELEKHCNWNKVSSLKKKFISLNHIIQPIQNFINDLNDIKELLNISIQNSDYNFLNEIYLELKKYKKKLKEIETKIFFPNKVDSLNCYLDLQSGSGGFDAQDWSHMLLKMYLRWGYLKGFKTDITHINAGDFCGLKSATIKILGKYAYGWFRTETGVHRLVRKSKFDYGNKRHTSFSSVFVYPEISDNIKIDINNSDLRIDVYRSSGSGGQHVNTTESAVRIIHIPTGIISQCQNERSQHKNKKYALKQLRSKLYKLELEKKQQIKKKIESNKSNITWGYQIRSYILDDSRIKDLRTGLETRDVQSILDGNLDFFIENNLRLGL